MTAKPDERQTDRFAALLAWRPPHWLTILIGLALIAGAWWLIYDELRAHSPGEILRALSSVPRKPVALAAAFVVLSFASLVADEWFALRILGAPKPLLKMLPPALATYAISNALSFSFATGPAVRTRLYRHLLSPVEIGTVSAVTGGSVFVGAAATTGLGLLLGAPEIAPHTFAHPLIWRAAGAALIVPAVIWSFMCFGPRHSVKWFGIRLTTPGPVSGHGQLFVAISGWVCAAAVLYELLPGHSGWSFPAFTAAFVAACYIGAASGAPAGLGVFDAAILTIAPGDAQAPETAAALIAYRIIYTLAPLCVGALILGRDLLSSRRHA